MCQGCAFLPGLLLYVGLLLDAKNFTQDSADHFRALDNDNFHRIPSSIQFLTRETPSSTKAAAANTRISCAGQRDATNSPAPKAAKHNPPLLHRLIKTPSLLLISATAISRVLVPAYSGTAKVVSVF